VVLPKFELATFCKAIETHKVTIAHIVPPIFILLAKEPSVTKYDLSSIRYFWSGAAPLSKELSHAVANRLNVGAIQGYGMTESSPVSHVPHLCSEVPGSIGELLPGMRARIVDEDGKGELLLCAFVCCVCEGQITKWGKLIIRCKAR
jgi:4-coumarate--CoA ligase